jgi:hypothetical protein
MRTDMWIYILFDVSDIHFHCTESFTRAAMSVYFRKLCTLHNTECHTQLSVHEWYLWGNSRGISTKLNALWATAQAASPAGVEHDSGAGSEDERHQHSPSSLPEKQRWGGVQARELRICQLRLKSFFNSDGDFRPRPPIRQWGSLRGLCAIKYPIVRTLITYHWWTTRTTQNITASSYFRVHNLSRNPDATFKPISDEWV